MSAYFFVPLVASLILYRLHQKYYNVLPRFRIWRIEFFPSIRVTIRGKLIHLHHWPSFALILTIVIFLEAGFLSSQAFKGFLAGGIIQGILDPTAPRIKLRG